MIAIACQFNHNKLIMAVVGSLAGGP